MRNLFIITLLTLGINLTNAQTNVSVEANGNLESPKPCGCVDILEVTSENNPADILIGMGKCIELKQFEKAARLFAISGVYGKYDSYRVKDKSAHQALLILQQSILLNIDEKDQQKLISSLEKELKAGSKELSDTCQAIQKVGIPKYYPKYMIQHGIQAFTESKENGLIEEFNSLESWNLALKSYLHCGE
jgi:hypothetical protein